MREKEFKQMILNEVKGNKRILNWYSKGLEDTPFIETQSRLSKAIEKTELTTYEALTLALFIGLTTK